MTVSRLEAPAQLRTGWSVELATAWRDSAVRRGMLASAFLLAAALTSSYSTPATPGQALMRDLFGYKITEYLAVAVVLTGVALLFDAWLRLRDFVADGVISARATLFLWCLPLLLAPPLFSSDGYAYAAQGNLVTMGINPYEAGPVEARDGFVAWVDPLWRATPSPYGPLALQINAFMVVLSGYRPLAAAILMRLPALLGVIGIVWGLTKLSRSLNVDPGKALWWGVLNPIFILHFVGGLHNDALMVGFGVVALALASQRKLLLGSVFLGLGMLIKQPIAALGPAMVLLACVDWKTRAMPSLTALVRRIVAAGTVTIATFVVGTAATGLGYGWVNASGVPGTVGSLSPSYNFGSLLRGFLRQVAGVSYTDLRTFGKLFSTTVMVVGALAVVAWAIWMLGKADRVFGYICWGMLLLAAVLPAVQVWYLLWGGVFIGFVKMRENTQRIVLLGMIALVCYSVVDAVFRTGMFSFVLIAIMGVACLAIMRRHLRGVLPGLSEIWQISKAKSDAVSMPVGVR